VEEYDMVLRTTINGNYLNGVNLPWEGYATDFGTGGWGSLENWPAVTSDLSTLSQEGVSTVRWWVFGDGRYSPVFNADGTVSGLNSGFFADLDKALQLAAQNNVQLLLTLTDFTMFNNASPQSNGVVDGGHANIIANPTVQRSFLDNALKPLLEHIAASPYKSADQIAGGYAGSSFFGGPAQFALSDVQNFVANAASYIHQYSGGGLATVGSAMPIWAPLWENLGLDFYEVHYYPWNDFSGPGTGLPNANSIVSTSGQHLDKPVIVGEFPTADTSYGLTDTNYESAEWYLNYIKSQGYAGELGWSVHAGDSSSNWAAFQPVFSNWVAQQGGSPPPPPPTAPPPPTIASFSPDVNGVDDNSTINLAGTAEGSSTVTVFDGTNQLGTTAVDTSGNWLFVVSNAVNGTHAFTATDTDANRTSVPSSPAFNVVVSVPPPPPPPTDLVVDGGFENGFTGWREKGSGDFSLTTDAHSGTAAAALHDSGGPPGRLSETLATVVGETYTLAFWLANTAAGNNSFVAKAGGQTLYTETNAGIENFIQHTASFTATSSSTTLQFQFQNSASWHLDDVSVVPSTA
jgi:hypothetical protein